MERLLRFFSMILLVVGSAGCQKSSLSGRIGFNVRSVETKGTVITTGNISSEYGSFVSDVWVADADKEAAAGHGNNQNYIQKAVVTYHDSTDPKWTFPEDKYWLNDVGMCFWSWAPVDVKDTDGTTNLRTIGNSVKDNTGALEFSYSLPTPDQTSDAENQKDLLFAFNYEKHSESDHKDIIDVRFYHALSWLKFMVDYNDGNFDSELEIENICLENIFASAQCTFKPTQAEVSDKFDWSSHSSKKNIGQDYTIAGDFTDNPSSQCYVTTGEKAFMVIPQTTPDDAEITVTFNQNETPTPITVAFNGQEWKPGKYYTYRIKAPSLGNILIECVVNDWIEDGESNLE